MLSGIRKSHRPLGLLMLLSVYGISGCAWQDPIRVEEDFGNSVRNMVAAQIYDPNAASVPSVDVPLLNGTAAGASISGYGSAADGARTARSREVGSPLPVTGQAENRKESD